MQAFAFCSTFIFRPIGALIFGWIGDQISRKSTVVITTTMMAVSCVIMANLPTYSQIGIIASWAITICRIVQGMSSMGELIGAELYLTETTKPPLQYPIVASVAVASVLGAVAALGIASTVLKCGLGWRVAFWIGAIIAIVGAIARTALRETPEFADAKYRLKKSYNELNIELKTLENDPIVNQKASNKMLLFLFSLYCEWPICFYFVYMYCGNILKNTFHYSSEEIIQHNFILSLIQLVSTLLVTILSYKIYPLKIIKTRLTLFLIFILFCPFLLQNITSASHLLLIQILIVSFAGAIPPAAPIFYKHLPIFKRFTYSCFLYALSRALIYVVTSFSIVFLTKYFDHYGFLIIALPVTVLCYFGVCHFEYLEKKVGNYP